MANEKKFEIKFAVKDEASQKINSFRQNIKALNTETKYHLKPLLDIRQAWMKVGLAWSFVAAGSAVTISKLVQMREEIKKLDELAIKLGVSSEKLSKQMYGFNIASDNARLGTGLWQASLDNIGKGFNWLKTKINETIGSFAIFNRASELAVQAGEGSNSKPFEIIAKRQLYNEQRKRLESSPAALNLKAEVLNKTRQLSMSERDFKDSSFGEELKSASIGGVNPSMVEEYRRAYNKRRNIEENKEYNKLLADRYKAEGDTLEAIKREQDNALQDYIIKWGEGSAMVENFKAGQRAILENAKLTVLGLKNNTQIWQDSQRQIIAGMSSTWESFFNDFFNRDLKKGYEYFRMFGQQILQTWSKMLAEMVTKYLVAQAQMASSQAAGGSGGKMSWINILGKVAGLVGGFAGIGSTITGGVGGTNTGMQMTPMGRAPTWSPFHSGGPVWPRAHDGLATDEVPIIAQRGEGILSRRGMAALGTGNLNRLNRGDAGGGSIVLQPTVIIQASDTQTGTEFILRHSEDVGHAIIASLLKNDVILRGALQKYGRK